MSKFSIKKLILLFVMIPGVLFSVRAQADSMREFLVCSAYGVLAGSLVGAATLALSEDPDDSYGNIAKGASLGLYGGMLLGGYLVFAVPSSSAKSNKAIHNPWSSAGDMPKVALVPLFKQEPQKAFALDGASLNFNLTRF